MSFKYFPWEIFKNHPHIVDLKRPGLYGICCYDPFVEKIIINSIPRKKLGAELAIVAGSEISRDWLEVNLRESDLFSGQRAFLVLQADEIGKQAQKFLIEEDWDWGQRFFIMAFRPESQFFDLLEEKQTGDFFKVEAPRFWEGAKLLRFLCEKTNVVISPLVQNYLLDSVPNTAGDLIHALKILALHFPQTSQITVVQAQSVISPQRLDQFELASIFGRREFKKFFKILINTDLDFDAQRSFFSFMQGHLCKLADPSYIQKKRKPSQYDRKILTQSGRFNLGELREYMHFFGRLEILSKQKSPYLINILRQKFMIQSL